MNGTPGDDSATHTNANTITQTNPNPVISVAEAVVTPAHGHWAIDLVPTILSSLNDGSPTALSDGTSPLGPGDIAWAWQWDVSIAKGATFSISKDKQITISPEPTSLFLLGSGLVGLGLGGRKRFSG